MFGTFNRDKAHEVQHLLGEGFRVLTCHDFPALKEVEETGDTLEANALLKVTGYHQATGLPTFADDTGLEVDALGGAPGVYAARYAGPAATYQDNVQKLLRELAGASKRSARFRTVIAWVEAEREARFFEGILAGSIGDAPAGAGGFGYDPVFIPEGSSRTLAAYSLAEKNEVSHRAKAVRALVSFLRAL